jgi:hypothetical protein
MPSLDPHAHRQMGRSALLTRGGCRRKFDTWVVLRRGSVGPGTVAVASHIDEYRKVGWHVRYLAGSSFVLGKVKDSPLPALAGQGVTE